MTSVPDDLMKLPTDTRAKVQDAIAKLETSRARSADPKKAITNREVRALSMTDTSRTAKLVKAHKLGRMPDPHTPGSWTPDLNARVEDGAEFAARVRAARTGTDDERAELAHEIAARVGTDQLSPQQANAMLSALKVATSAKKEHRTSTGGRDVENFILCGPEEFELVRVYRGIVSDSRRQQVLEFAISEAREDLRANPEPE